MKIEIYFKNIDDKHLIMENMKKIMYHKNEIRIWTQEDKKYDFKTKDIDFISINQ